MDIYKAELNQRLKRTPTIESFRFFPSEKINFTPGQFLRLIFDKDNLGNKELNKYLSFSSSPAKDYIEVTKRLSESQFSDKLKSLNLGDQGFIQAPLGSCVFKDEYKKIAFLIGGIGITPVISILEYIVDKGLKTDVYLFYSNRNEEEIAFKEELDNWQVANRGIKVVYTLTEAPSQKANCRFGYINKELLLQNIKDTSERIFYIFGPPKMVEAMERLCKEMVVADEKIKTEIFMGY